MRLRDAARIPVIARGRRSGRRPPVDSGIGWPRAGGGRIDDARVRGHVRRLWAALISVASTMQRWLPVVTVVVGIVLVVLGLLLLAGRTLTLPSRSGGRPMDRVASPLTMTSTEFPTPSSLGCTIRPFRDVTATSFRAGNILEGCRGFRHLRAGLVVGVLAIGAS